MKKPHHRQFLALSIVEAIQRSGAKFLRKENSRGSILSDVWKTVSVKEACIKTSQALRDANIRISKITKVQLKGKASTSGSAVPNHTTNESRPDRNVISPSNISARSKHIPSELPPVPSLMPSGTTHFSEDLDGIDHIDLETVQTLLRSLGGYRQQQGQQESSCNSSTTRTSSKRRSWSHWPREPLQTQLKIQNHTSSLQAVLVCDWVSKEPIPVGELPPATLKPSNQAIRQDFSSSTRWSISSVSMLEPGLFSADFEFDGFDIDSEMFAAGSVDEA
jgi:hypothetical protein